MLGPIVNLILRTWIKRSVGKGLMAPRVGEDIEPEAYNPEDWRIPPPEFLNKPRKE